LVQALKELELRKLAASRSAVGDAEATGQDALVIAPGVWLDQLTEKGVALELATKGTKSYKDDDLNGGRTCAAQSGFGWSC
jgi:hypothetical protein